ncbi:MAG TPA: hypothetical protein DCG49_02495 [Ruminococcus sp.]|nr:hypothetical protein [Ruminococcus sp.]
MQKFICEPGRIVLCKAGRESGRYFLVTALEGADLLLVDGKHRLMQNPKRKNPLHVQATAQTIPLSGLTDKAIRKILNPLNETVNRPQSKFNQIRKEVIDDVETGCN